MAGFISYNKGSPPRTLGGLGGGLSLPGSHLPGQSGWDLDTSIMVVSRWVSHPF